MNTTQIPLLIRRLLGRVVEVAELGCDRDSVA
jgi:hypothetical protein